MDNLLLPKLSATELRVLGSLLEKSRTTPEYYPMTLNALIAACNQKTSRKPVVNFDDSTVIQALDNLRKKSLISTVVGGGSRVTKYKHNMGIIFPLVPADLAVLCLLILRGPLTAGEINSYSGRLYEFDGLDEVTELLNKLAEAEPTYIKLVSRKPGQKESRYVHLFGEFESEEEDTNTYSNASEHIQALESRVASLEEQLSDLRLEFDKLMQELS